jgi:hypothetical protein
LLLADFADQFAVEEYGLDEKHVKALMVHEQLAYLVWSAGRYYLIWTISDEVDRIENSDSYDEIVQAFRVEKGLQFKRLSPVDN